MSWSATQYTKFEAERNRPIQDLLAQLPPVGVITAIDIGCGPGNSTELIVQRYPEATVSGMDSSANMIEAARKRLPDLNFEVADISTWADPGPYDLILANAALHWVPDHDKLLPALLEKLSSGGLLAVQMPDNVDEPAHVLMRKLALEGPWSAKLSTVASNLPPRHSAEWYFRLLRPLVSDVDVWNTTYFHHLPGGASAVVEWFKGSGLRPYIEPLSEDERIQFLARYEAEVAKAYVALDDGAVLLPFPRLFFIAKR